MIQNDGFARERRGWTFITCKQNPQTSACFGRKFQQPQPKNVANVKIKSYTIPPFLYPSLGTEKFRLQTLKDLCDGKSPDWWTFYVVNQGIVNKIHRYKQWSQSTPCICLYLTYTYIYTYVLCISSYQLLDWADSFILPKDIWTTLQHVNTLTLDQ